MPAEGLIAFPCPPIERAAAIATTALRTIRSARLITGDVVDIELADGRVTSIAPATARDGGRPTSPRASELDAAGYVLLPPLVESHVHLDTTLWGEPWRPNLGGPSIPEFIANERRVLASLTSSPRERAGRLLAHLLGKGSLHVRSHVQVTPDVGLRHVQDLLALREAWRGRVELQLVAFPQTGMLIQPGVSQLMDEAAGLGVDCVGGIDPAGVDRDPIGQLRAVFGIAERHGRGVDIHLHDEGELGVWQIERIADFTEATGLAGKVMISHAYALGMVPLRRIEALARRLADLRISLMTTAPADVAMPPVAELRSLGVNICLGSDGIRDSWTPLGTGDMLERAMLLAYRHYWGRDEQLLTALDMATHAGARALGLADYGVAAGGPADLVLVKAENACEAVVAMPQERLVVKGGRLVARDGVPTDIIEGCRP